MGTWWRQCSKAVVKSVKSAGPSSINNSLYSNAAEKKRKKQTGAIYRIVWVRNVLFVFSITNTKKNLGLFIFISRKWSESIGWKSHAPRLGMKIGGTYFMEKRSSETIIYICSFFSVITTATERKVLMMIRPFEKIQRQFFFLPWNSYFVVSGHVFWLVQSRSSSQQICLFIFSFFSLSAKDGRCLLLVWTRGSCRVKSALTSVFFNIK